MPVTEVALSQRAQPLPILLHGANPLLRLWPAAAQRGIALQTAAVERDVVLLGRTIM
jgi:hypothetical protein